MTKIKRWVTGLLLVALLVFGASAIPASGHRSAAAKRAEARQDARLAHTLRKDRKKLAADQARETKLSGLHAATVSEDEEEAQDEENEAAEEQQLDEDEQGEDEQTAAENEDEEDEQEEGGEQ